MGKAAQLSSVKKLCSRNFGCRLARNFTNQSTTGRLEGWKSGTVARQPGLVSVGPHSATPELLRLQA